MESPSAAQYPTWSETICQKRLDLLFKSKGAQQEPCLELYSSLFSSVAHKERKEGRKEWMQESCCLCSCGFVSERNRSVCEDLLCEPTCLAHSSVQPLLLKNPVSSYHTSLWVDNPQLPRKPAGGRKECLLFVTLRTSLLSMHVGSSTSK